jgi:hypothetical protein
MPATLYSSNYQAAFVDANPSKFGKGEYNGTVECQYAEHTFAASVNGIGDIIKMGKLPAGARVLGTVVKCPSTGTTGKFEFGYAANGVDVIDEDAFDADADSGGAAIQSEGDGVGIGKKFTVATDTQLQLTEATDTAIGVVIQTWVFFVVD